MSRYNSEVIHATLNNDQARFVAIRANGAYADAVTDALTYSRAADAINAKASSLGYGSQDGVGVEDVTPVLGGYLRRHANYDIYSTGNGAAFEVHGAIRAKYNALGGAAGLLGMPVTDEQGAPDGAGRYNHFDHGSIYWTDRTGPMSVTGTVRDRWASTGWERGPFGYPVQDQHRVVAIPAIDPVVEWCRFENGVIAGDAQGGNDAPHATVTYAELGAIVRARLNAQFQASPDNVALRAGIGLAGVSDWQYDFRSSISRSVGFRIRGFSDNGLANDTDFTINIWLRFELVWGPTFTEPTSKTLVAVLESLRVIHDGGPPVVGGKVISAVSSAIAETFFPSVWPDPAHPEVSKGTMYVADVPTGASVRSGVIDILDVLVSAAGDLQLLVNPLAPPEPAPGDPNSMDWGYLRQFLAQNQIDALKI
ncbi:MAG: LGFP repeat-containing protein [Gemmatimonadaceae bacterium]